MKLSKKAKALILKDQTLRLKLALAMGIGEAGVMTAAKRGSGSLLKVQAIEVIKEHTGWMDSDIYGAYKSSKLVAIIGLMLLLQSCLPAGRIGSYYDCPTNGGPSKNWRLAK